MAQERDWSVTLLVTCTVRLATAVKEDSITWAFAGIPTVDPSALLVMPAADHFLPIGNQPQVVVARPVAASCQQDSCAEPEELYLTAQFFRARPGSPSGCCGCRRCRNFLPVTCAEALLEQ